MMFAALARRVWEEWRLHAALEAVRNGLYNASLQAWWSEVGCPRAWSDMVTQRLEVWRVERWSQAEHSVYHPLAAWFSLARNLWVQSYHRLPWRWTRRSSPLGWLWVSSFAPLRAALDATYVDATYVDAFLRGRFGGRDAENRANG